MPTRIAGIQPGYLPWLGYFDQMRRVDAFIVADEMQYTSSGWAHRNRVRGPHGAYWLTLPVRPHLGQRICEVELNPRVRWAERHLAILSHFYRRSPHAAALLAELEERLPARAQRLVEVTVPLLYYLRDLLGISTPLLVSSTLGLEAQYRAMFPDNPGPTQRIIAFMKVLGATSLLQGQSGRQYLDLELCRRHGIAVEFQDYPHPVYPQLFQPFVSHLSVIDLLLCCGPREARRVLESVP